MKKTLLILLMTVSMSASLAAENRFTKDILSIQLSQTQLEVEFPLSDGGSSGGGVGTDPGISVDCVLTPDGNFLVESSNPLFDEIFSMLVSARMTGQMVTVVFMDDPRANCTIQTLSL